MTPETAREHSEHLGWEGPGDADIHPADIADAFHTLAALEWQYGVEQDSNPSTVRMGDPPTRRFIDWRQTEADARRNMRLRFIQDRNPRLVWRLVGAVEEVEE